VEDNRQERGPPDGKMSRDPDERRRALRKGEMVNEFKNKVNWREYYQKILSEEYNPEHFDDGERATMPLNGQTLLLEMKSNGEWSVIGIKEGQYETDARNRVRSAGYDGREELAQEREEYDDRGNRTGEGRKNSGREGTGDYRNLRDTEDGSEGRAANAQITGKASMEPTSEFKPKRKVNAAELSETTKQAVKDGKFGGKR